MEKPPDGGAVDLDAALGQFETQFVQGHFAMQSNALTDPFPMRRKLTARRMPLSGGTKRTRGTMQDHHIVDEPGRNPEMPGGFPITIAFITNATTRSRNSIGCGLPMALLLPWAQSSTNQAKPES